MITRQERTEQLVGACVCITFILACLGVVSSVMWYKTAQEAKKLTQQNASQSAIITALSSEVVDKRGKIQQANRLLAMTYPKSDRHFISED